MTTFELNGEQVTIRGGHEHLLSALRDELDVTSPKDGCSPSGQCGCCTVLVDGKARVSGQTPLERVEGTSVVTLEGVDAAERDRMAAAFAAHGALQCGFCTPGIVMRTKAMLDKTADGEPITRDRAARLLGAHLCRCTGYVKFLDAIESLARDEVPVSVRPGGVGTRGVKNEANELTLGERDFIDDMRPEGLLHGAVHLAAHARADVLSIDTSEAEAVPGVVRVFTAAAVPGELRSGLIHKDWPVFIPVGGRTSYLGDVLALVVADTRATARRAAALVEVAYRPLDPLTNPVEALESTEDAVWGLDGNRLSTSAYVRGEVDEALQSSAHVVSETFQTQRIDHAFLEPESTLALPVPAGESLPLTGEVTGRDPVDFRRLMVFSGGQGIWDDRNDIAAILGVERERVTVELVSNGGAFGGKEDMSNQGHAALAAWLLGQPVKCTLSRVESFRMHAKRHPITLDVRAGCDADGVLTGLHVRAIGDSGAYASVGMKVLERAAGHVAGPYRWQSLDIEATAVRTNNPICGAFRGFGANQAQFATEGVIDRLAELAGIDPWEFRSKNVITPGDTWGPGQVMDDGAGGARECLDAIKPDYDRARSEGRSVGLAIGMKNSGLGNGFREVCGAVVHFRDDGRIEVRHGWTEMGQGVHTVALQVAAQELNVDAARIDVIVDTTRELGFGQTTGSRGTLMTAGSVAAACQTALAANCEVGADHHGEYVVDWTHHLGDPEHPNPTIHSCFSYAAQLVEIDNASGAIDRVLAVHDVGKAVNPTLVEGQIEGSVHMGLGYALTEDFPSDETGMPAVDTLRQLGILRAKDIPKIDVKVVEVPQPRSPYGIKGVGEIGLVPTAPAVAAALYDFDGDRRRTLPMRRQ